MCVTQPFTYRVALNKLVRLELLLHVYVTASAHVVRQDRSQFVEQNYAHHRE